MKLFSSLFSAGLLALLLLAVRLPAAAQAPTWQSVIPLNAAVTATAVDATGNIYLAGSFGNTLVLGNTTLVGSGPTVFVAKYNTISNQFVWAQQGGGSSANVIVSALAVSGNSVYIAGYFMGATVSFGATVLTNAGVGVSTDGFVAKLTDAGTTGSFEWAHRVGGVNNEQIAGLAVSGNSVYVAGKFSSAAVSFGTTTLSQVGIIDMFKADGFVAKLTDAGSTSSYVWVHHMGGFSDDAATVLAVNGSSVYVAGYFSSDVLSLGTVTLVNTGPLNYGRQNIFVAKLIDAGSTSNFVWAQGAPGIGPTEATALAVSGTSVYVGGEFGGPFTLGGTTLSSVRLADIFVAKLMDAGSTGNFVWAQRGGGQDYGYGYDKTMALFLHGTSLFVAGSVSSGYGASAHKNAYVGKFTDAGNTSSLQWEQMAGGQGDDGAVGVVVSGTKLYVMGNANARFSSLPNGTTDVYFGTINFTLQGQLGRMGFLSTIIDPTITATTAGIPRESSQLYPNPARYAATLRLPAGTAPAPLTLTDALGRAVRRYPAPASPEATLDLRGLPAGLYLLGGAGPAQRLQVE